MQIVPIDEEQISRISFSEVDSLCESSEILIPTDYIEENENEPKKPTGSSWYAATFIVTNAALGPVVLSFPEAYHRCGGIFTALIIQVAMLMLAYSTLRILATCADISKAETFQDVMEKICGRWGKLVSGACIAIFCLGTCVSFLIVIGDQFETFLNFVSVEGQPSTKWYLNQKFLVSITSAIFILPLCFPKRIDFLKNVSAVGVLSILYVSVVIIAKYFTGPNHISPIRTKPASWTDVFLVIPTICVGYQCHVSIVPVYSCLRDRNLNNFSKTASSALVICALCYSLVAVFGYLTFGGDVSADILVSYQPTPDVLIAMLLLAIKICTAYPILHFCGRSAFESVLIEVTKMSPERIASGEKYRRYLETIIWFVTTIVLSVAFPDITNVISLLGSLAVFFILVLPGVCWLQVSLGRKKELSKARFILNMVGGIMLILLGVFISGISTAQVIMNQLKSAHESLKS